MKEKPTWETGSAFFFSGSSSVTYCRQAARPIPLDKSQLQRIADKVVRMLPRHLKFRNMGSPLWMARGFNPNTWGFHVDVYSVKDVRGFPVHAPIEVRAKESKGDWTSPRKYIAGGVVKQRFQPDSRGMPKGYGSKIGFVIYVNQLISPEEILANLPKVKKEVYSVLIHEMTHMRDLILHPSVELKGQDPEDPEVYYNRPSEVRAFMQQVADEVIEYAEEVGKDDPFFLYLNTRFVERALEKSPTWERIREALNPQNTRLVLRGVTRALQDVWPELKRKYPLEDDDLLTASKVAARYLAARGQLL